jgi:phage terminase small subunit|tara:strand:- start:419 stop:964 length:546 start_codon:yes stop_codon:yes gene_type:complete
MKENKELQEQVFIPDPLSDALFNPKITGKQRKFALLLVHSEGLHTATHCAIQAGYAKDSAVVRASELQHPEKYPLVAKAIESERRAIVERYKCTQERSLSTLARIRDKASESGNWNAAVAAETRRGQIAGLYVDKKEILTGTIDSMNREEVEKKLQDLKEQYSITADFEELKDMKQIDNKS